MNYRGAVEVLDFFVHWKIKKRWTDWLFQKVVVAFQGTQQWLVTLVPTASFWIWCCIFFLVFTPEFLQFLYKKHQFDVILSSKDEIN